MPGFESYLTVTLSLENAVERPVSVDNFEMESVEAVGQDCKLRLTFKNKTPLVDALSSCLANEIEETLAKFDRFDQLMSFPDYQVTCCDLYLAKLSVFGAVRDTGRTVVTLRWSHFVGNVCSVVRIGPEFLTALGVNNASLAFDVLDCLLQPIFDMTKLEADDANDLRQTETVRKLLGEFVTKRNELEKYADMLRIYIKHEALLREPDKPIGSPADGCHKQKPRYLC